MGRLPGGVREAARSGRCLQVEVVLFGGAAQRSSATDLPPPSRSQLPGAVLCDFPSPVAGVRRRRMCRDLEVEDTLKHGDGGRVPGWRLFEFEVRRLPVRRRAPSDPRHGRSCGGAPAARPVARQRHRVPAGLICNLVHVSAVGPDQMRVTWITDDDAPATVEYGTVSGQYPFSATGNTTAYSFIMYHSGNIHDAVVGPLKPSTTYYYRCSSDPSLEFSFRTPPAGLPFNFVIAGDLGQTEWTNSTLQHIAAADYDMLLLPGDLSYADLDQPRWDSYGRLVEPLASARPWMVTQGNHEVEKIPLIEHKFKAYNARWRMPYDAGGSPSGSNLFYSFDVAGGAVHVIMLGSYTDYDTGTAQYSWLQGDLARIDRGKAAFVVALVHAPWYNSNEAHQGEGDAMRDAMEAMLYGARVDAVFAGHVHAYERFARVYGGKEDQCGPVYVTIGDGGNREGLAEKYIDRQPKTSVYREASFGHGRLQVANATHALWTWHRNDDDEPVVTDQVWITSLASNPNCNKK